MPAHFCVCVCGGGGGGGGGEGGLIFFEWPLKTGFTVENGLDCYYFA